MARHRFRWRGLTRRVGGQIGVAPARQVVYANRVSVNEIKKAIEHLSVEERLDLMQWLEQYKEDDWDRQISADAASGKLDFLAKEASQAKQYGKLKPLPGEVEDHS